MLLLEAPSREQDIDKHDSYLSLTNICKRLEASFLRTSDTAAEPNKRHSYHLCRQPCSSTRASKPAVDSTLSGQRVTGSTTRLVLGNPSQQSAPVRPRSSYISVRRRASDPAKPVSPCANTFLPTCIRATAASLELSSARDGKDSKSTRSSSGGTKSTGTDPANSNSGYAEDQKPDSRSIKDDDDDEEDDDSDDEEEDEDEDEEGDDGVVRCVCGERNDGELMIECEICQVWQHTLCMGIRDEAHIPDKYYCEKCRPEDHPYINSRPRTLVLAEASALGTTTMMRRSAVMAVAKMTAREEYRSAAAAAAIAASVAASASSSTGRSGSANGSGRKTPKKPGRKPEGAASSATPNQARKGKKSRRQGQRVDGSRNTGGDDPAAENSDSEYTRGSKGADASRFGAGMAYGDAYNSNGYEDDDDDNDDGSNGSRTSHSRAQRQGNGPRKTQTPKRSSVPGNTNGGKRRKVANQSPAISSRSGHSNSVDSGMRQSYAGEDDEIDGNESSGVDDPGFGDDPDAQYAQEDVVARMMGAKISDSTPRSNRSKTRTPKSRNRSISTIVKSNAGDSGRNGLAVGSPSRRPLKNEYSGDAAGKRRGKSAPGSPRLVSRSPSPSLQSLLYDDASNGGVAVEGHSGVNGPTKADRSAKRRRTGGGSNRGGVGKHSRMAVSATNSPYLGNGSVFGSFDEGLERQRGRAASNSATALADTKGKSADAGGAEFDAYGTNESEGAYDYGKVGATEYLANEDQHDDGSSSGNHQSSIHNRQPKHKFPPLETTDIDGNKVIIPSHLLNNHGLPMYSSADTETMCKIRYPHNKTSVFELNRRAKQLLEWLGKMQSEYEHEVNSLVEPLDAKNSTVSSEHEKAKSIEERLASSSAKRNNSSAIDRVGSHQVSEAPTSPIDPADWPDEEGYDGEGHGDAKDNDGDGAPKQPRSTLSIMEDLVWRLIRFQETYST
ncbi:Histone deacetylase complex subunit [Coemansia sp. RSA 1646]|nr:Histone deacetylase complex subunit [Coemansia sp. RSA 1646]